MKRYLVFAFDHYYPAGGMSDFRMDFEFIEDAQQYIIDNRKKFDNFQIFDNQEKKIMISKNEKTEHRFSAMYPINDYLSYINI